MMIKRKFAKKRQKCCQNNRNWHAQITTSYRHIIYRLTHSSQHMCLLFPISFIRKKNKPSYCTQYLISLVLLTLIPFSTTESKEKLKTKCQNVPTKQKLANTFGIYESAHNSINLQDKFTG